MFEKALPVTRPQTCDALPGGMIVGNRDSAMVRGGDALRAIDWNELTARLNAARDLRRVLRRDARASIQSAAASFGDAAATYFQSLGNDEHDVNPVALEHSKASRGIVADTQNDAPSGDAREEYD